MNELNFFDKFLRTFSRGETIFTKGSFGQFMYVISSGSVNIINGDAGNEAIVGTLGQGEIFGEMALVDNLPRSATAVAGDDNTVSLFNALDSQSEFSNIMKSIATYSKRV